MTANINMGNLMGGGAGKLPQGIGMRALVNGASGLPGGKAGISDDAEAATGQNPQAGNTVSPFQLIYNEIALSNQAAQSADGAAVITDPPDNDGESADDSSTDPAKDSGSQTILTLEMIKEMMAQTSANILPGLSGEGLSASNVSGAADQLLRQAILTITQTLNLKVQAGTDTLSLANPTTNTINQLAEMLSALKGIANALNETVQTGQPLPYGNTIIDAATAGNMEKTLHEQVFKIEMALKLAGISGDVSTEQAAIDNTVLSTGIAQATDPATLSMPAVHVQQIVGQQVPADGQTVQGLFATLVSALQGKTAPDSKIVLQKIASTAADAGQGNAPATGADPGTINSKVLRTLLNVDGDPAKSAGTQNTAAAQQNEKSDLPKAVGVVFGKALDEALLQTKDDKNAGSQMDADLLSSTGTPSQATVSAVLPSVPQPLDDSVMSQVLDKLNLALQSGITEMKLTLRPESLGDVQIKIRVEGDVVTGKIYVENQQVKHIVQANLDSLKNALAHHQLHAGAFDVDVNHGNDTREQMQMMAEDGSQNSRDGGGANEGSVTRENNRAAANPVVTHGTETGRRYGSNTIEFFA